MNKRLWIWVSAVFAVFTAVLVIVELSSEHNYKKAILSSRLEAYADIICRSGDYAGTTALLPEGIRVSVIREDGSVIFDSYNAGGVAGNHLSRPEIKACLKGKDGCSIRRSDTSGMEYIYFARRYGNIIIRTALPFEMEQKRFMHPNWALVMTVCMLFGIAVVLIRRLSLRADKAARKEADQELQSQKNRITGNLAHELRTPVTSIRGYLETLVGNPSMDAQKRELFISRAYVQTLRLSELIRDISLITKMEEAPEKLQKEYVCFKKVVDDVAEELSAQIRDKGIKLENLIPEDLSIKGNHSLLYALIRNLVENSIRYGGQGITIQIESCIEEDYARISYFDNGKGVSEKHIDRIFERFYRIPEEDAYRAEGSGLGLSIVRNAVIFHGGSISATALVPHGLRFDFTLPLD